MSLLAWSVQRLTGGGFTAHRREWLQPTAAPFFLFAAFLFAMEASSLFFQDMGGAFGFLAGLLPVLFGCFLAARRQKSFSVHGTRVVAEDWRWPAERRSVRRFDLEDARAFLVEELSPTVPSRRPTWALDVSLQDGARVRLLSELRTRREAEWLQSLASQAAATQGMKGFSP